MDNTEEIAAKGCLFSVGLVAMMKTGFAFVGGRPFRSITPFMADRAG